MALADLHFRQAEQYKASARRLAVALAEFQATCADPEFRLRDVGPETAYPLYALAEQLQRTGAFVRQVAADFEQADRARAYFASKEAADAAARAADVAAIQSGELKPIIAPDFWVSRAADVAIEEFKAHVEPHIEAGPVELAVSFAAEKLTLLRGTVVWVTRSAVQITLRDEVTNGAGLALKDFVASPLKGVPLLNGALQFATDYVGEPNLSTDQRAVRILVSAALAAGVAVLAVAVLPEGALAVTAGLGLNVGVDLFVKPLLFDTLGLKAQDKRDR